MLAAEGDEWERPCRAPLGEGAWRERVWRVRSPRHAHHQAAGLATRRCQAETHLPALTPPRGRGKRHITDDAPLVAAIDRVRTAQRVHGLLRVAWDKPVAQTTPDVGRGRGSKSRETRGIQKIRDPIPPIARPEDTSAALHHRFGGTAVVTKAGHKRLALPEAVWCDRHADRVERLFNRLKSRVHLAPRLVKRHEPIEGLTYLRTLGVRVCTVTACVLRRALAHERARLAD